MQRLMMIVMSCVLWMGCAVDPDVDTSSESTELRNQNGGWCDGPNYCQQVFDYLTQDYVVFCQFDYTCWEASVCGAGCHISEGQCHCPGGGGVPWDPFAPADPNGPPPPALAADEEMIPLTSLAPCTAPTRDTELEEAGRAAVKDAILDDIAQGREPVVDATLVEELATRDASTVMVDKQSCDASSAYGLMIRFQCWSDTYRDGDHTVTATTCILYFEENGSSNLDSWYGYREGGGPIVLEHKRCYRPRGGEPICGI